MTATGAGEGCILGLASIRVGGTYTGLAPADGFTGDVVRGPRGSLTFIGTGATGNGRAAGGATRSGGLLVGAGETGGTATVTP